MKKKLDIPNELYESTEIKEELEKIFDEFIVSNEQAILSKYTENKFDKNVTLQDFKSSHNNLSEQKFQIHLLKLDKEIPIIFEESHFSNPDSKVSSIDSIDQFVSNNIIAFTTKPSRFNKNNLDKEAKDKIDSADIELYYTADIERCLKHRFSKLDKKSLKEIYTYYEKDHTPSQTSKYFAEKLILHKNDIESFLMRTSFKNLSKKIRDEEELVNEITEIFTKKLDLKNYNRDLKKIISRFLPLILSNGFPDNITNVDSGIMVANAGDSAQFIFIARAILAGFDSSNVDVRSSRYDCIVDYKSKIFRVQVKGISQDTVNYKDRDRGGTGNDYRNNRNRGRRITKGDCDIYAAVDKKTGVVYLIPISHLEENKQIQSEKIQDLKQFRENWGIFAELHSEVNGL